MVRRPYEWFFQDYIGRLTTWLERKTGSWPTSVSGFLLSAKLFFFLEPVFFLVGRRRPTVSRSRSRETRRIVGLTMKIKTSPDESMFFAIKV
jgi:hypothetical protein